MPIYEYVCENCGRVKGFLLLAGDKEDELRCDRCGKTQLRRIMSRFSIHKTETQRLKEFDTKAPRDDSFYKDSRNIGLWAKKRAQELGVADALGSKFDEVVERARTGKILEDYDL